MDFMRDPWRPECLACSRLRPKRSRPYKLKNPRGQPRGLAEWLAKNTPS